MFTLLVIIYVAFIGLGLPDGLLGSGWPAMYRGFGVGLSSAGILSMITSGGTIISSLLSDKIIRKYSTGGVTAVSVLMTAVALLGFSLSQHFAFLCLLAIPLGLGAGSVDTALNNFVALHYQAKHMSWLHCFWGIGASLGPAVMSFSLSAWQNWRFGYGLVSLVQFAIVIALFISLPLWKKAVQKQTEGVQMAQKPLPLKKAIAIKGVKPVMASFFGYCAVESTVGLWGSSYLVTVRGLSNEVAASWISLYFLGITIGRLLSGFLAIKLSHRQMISLGLALIGLGVGLLFIPLHAFFALISLFLVGLGCAPIFPSLLHETPVNFGKENSQTIMGIQMASAYVGATFMPPLFGLLGSNITFALFPIFIGLAFLLMLGMIMLARKQINPKVQKG